MAQTKQELLDQAKKLNLDVDPKLKVAEIKQLLEQHDLTVEAKDQPEDKTTVAKSGKRSAKAIKEAEELAAKEDRKAHPTDGATKAKLPIKPTRSRLERRGKHFRNSAAKIEKGKLYPIEEAVKLAKTTSHVKFDATVELHINLGVDPRHADQNIRDNVVLPAGTGKKVRVAALTDDPAVAKSAGAEIAGTDDLLAQLEKGIIDFDVLVSTPALMPKLGKYARLLGPRGLMPNPKSGTVTNDINKAVAEAKAGRVEYRVDSTGIIHLGVGKVSFDDAKLLSNIAAVIASIKSNKPQSLKGNYFKAMYLSTSMGPSVSVDLSLAN